MSSYLPRKQEKSVNSNSIQEEAVHLCYVKALIETSGLNKYSTPGPSLVTGLFSQLTPDKLSPLLDQFKAMGLNKEHPPNHFKVDIAHTSNLRLQLKVKSNHMFNKNGRKHTL